MVNLLFQETSNLLLGANVTSQKPALRKAGYSVLFLVSFAPSSSYLLLLSCPLLPLLFTSVHPFIILRRALTTETPLCTQVLLRPHSSPQHPHVCGCVCVCVESLRKGTRETECFSLTDRFCDTVIQIIFPLLQPAQATYSQLPLVSWRLQHGLMS